MPKELPTTCLSVEPRFDPAVLAKHNMSAAKSVQRFNPASANPLNAASARRPLSQVNQFDGRGDCIEAQSLPQVPTVMENSFKYMAMIREQLTKLLSKPNLIRPDKLEGS